MLQHDRGRYLVQHPGAAVQSWLGRLVEHGRTGTPPDSALGAGLQRLGLAMPLRPTITLVGQDRLARTLQHCLGLAGVSCRQIPSDRWVEVGGSDGLVIVIGERWFDPAPCWSVCQAHLPLLVAEVNHQGARFGQFLQPGSLLRSATNWSSQFAAVDTAVERAPGWLLDWLVQRCAATALTWLETGGSTRPDRWAVMDRQAVGMEALDAAQHHDLPRAA